jgi:hypothetical protein
MLLELIQMFAPNYYKRVWNDEFIKEMEKTRQELYLEYPGPKAKQIIDERMTKSYETWLKR